MIAAADRQLSPRAQVYAAITDLVSHRPEVLRGKTVRELMDAWQEIGGPELCDKTFRDVLHASGAWDLLLHHPPGGRLPHQDTPNEARRTAMLAAYTALKAAKPDLEREYDPQAVRAELARRCGFQVTIREVCYARQRYWHAAKAAAWRCDHCGGPARRPGTASQFCCRACWYAHCRAKQAAALSASTRLCAWCHQPPRSPWPSKQGRFCSQRCRYAADRQRRTQNSVRRDYGNGIPIVLQQPGADRGVAGACGGRGAEQLRLAAPPPGADRANDREPLR